MMFDQHPGAEKRLFRVVPLCRDTWLSPGILGDAVLRAYRRAPGATRTLILRTWSAASLGGVAWFWAKRFFGHRIVQLQPPAIADGRSH